MGLAAEIPAAWVSTRPSRLWRMPVNSSAADSWVFLRRCNSSSSVFPSISGKKSRRHTQLPFSWHTSRDSSNITGPERPHSVNCISPTDWRTSAPLWRIWAWQFARTPLRDTTPPQPVFTCTKVGRRRVQ